MSNISGWGALFVALSSSAFFLAYTHREPELAALGVSNIAMGVYVVNAEGKAKDERDRLLQMIKSRPVVLKASTLPTHLATQDTSEAQPIPPKKVLPPGTIATHPRGYKPPAPVPEDPAPAPNTTEPINQFQYQQLVKRLQGDRAQAERLINYEQNKAPERTRQWALDKALESLSRDRH